MAPRNKPLMRFLGEFVGHVAKGFTAPLKPKDARLVVRREVEEHQVETPQGPVTLRRTTIDEVELSKPKQT